MFCFLLLQQHQKEFQPDTLITFESISLTVNYGPIPSVRTTTGF